MASVGQEGGAHLARRALLDVDDHMAPQARAHHDVVGSAERRKPLQQAGTPMGQEMGERAVLLNLLKRPKPLDGPSLLQSRRARFRHRPTPPPRRNRPSSGQRSSQRRSYRRETPCDPHRTPHRRDGACPQEACPRLSRSRPVPMRQAARSPYRPQATPFPIRDDAGTRRKPPSPASRDALRRARARSARFPPCARGMSRQPPCRIVASGGRLQHLLANDGHLPVGVLRNLNARLVQLPIVWMGWPQARTWGIRSRTFRILRIVRARWRSRRLGT